MSTELDREIDFSDSTVKETWKAMVDGKSENRWVLFELKDEDQKVFKMLVAETGKKGLKELKIRLAANIGKVLFGVLLVLGVDKQGGVTSTRKKWVYFTYVGNNVTGVDRGKANFLKQRVAKFFGAVALTCDTTGATLSDFSDKYLCKALLAAGAAHKPTHMNFGEEDVLVADLTAEKVEKHDDDFD